MTTLTDADLEARLRATYRSVTATTAATPRALPRPSTRLSAGRGLAVAGVIGVLIAALVAVVQVRGTASARPPEGRHAVMSFFVGYGFAGVRPYVAATDGFGDATGEVLQYRRSTGTIDVISVRGALTVPDDFVETTPVHGRTAYTNRDGSMLLWRQSDDVAVALRITGTSPGPDLDAAAIADTVVLVGDAAWTQLQQRQGFARLRVGRDNPSETYPVADGVVVERTVTGTLRSGVQVIYEIGPDALTLTSYGTMSVPSRLDLLPVGDDRMVVMAWGPASATGSITFDGAPVDVHTVVDPQRGAVLRLAVVRAGSSTDHSAQLLDENGRVQATGDWAGRVSS